MRKSGSLKVRKLIKGREIVGVKFYGARYPRELDSVKHNRDEAFYQHLQKCGVQVCFGKFKIIEEGYKKIALEKGVDVMLAADLILDAVYEKYDDAYVFSSDTDLVPAIVGAQKIGKTRQIHHVSVCRYPSQEFIDCCNGTLNLYSKLARQCLSTDFKPSTATLNDLKAKFDKGRS